MGQQFHQGLLHHVVTAQDTCQKSSVYLTEHVGLQIIPINLILQIIVSYLVAVNSSIAISAYTLSKKGTKYE